MAAVILDTNAISGFAEGDEKLLRLLPGSDGMSVPVVVLGEYLFGIRQSRHRDAYERWLAERLAVWNLLPVTRFTAECYAEIRSQLQAAGKPIPTNDLWIAAMAREHGLPVVSRDRHFAAVKGIRLLVW